mgnify:CR=1 FL=1
MISKSNSSQLLCQLCSFLKHILVAQLWVSLLCCTSDVVTHKRQYLNNSIRILRRYLDNTPRTKEAYFYRSIFESHFPQKAAADTVPGAASAVLHCVFLHSCCLLVAAWRNVRLTWLLHSVLQRMCSATAACAVSVNLTAELRNAWLHAAWLQGRLMPAEQAQAAHHYSLDVAFAE